MEREIHSFTRETITGHQIGVVLYRRDHEVFNRRGDLDHVRTTFFGEITSTQGPVSLQEILDISVPAIDESKQIYLRLTNGRELYINNKGVVFEDVQARKREDIGEVSLKHSTVELGNNAIFQFKRYVLYPLGFAGSKLESQAIGTVEKIRFSEEKAYK